MTLNSFIQRFTALITSNHCLALAKRTKFCQRLRKILPNEMLFSQVLGQMSALHPSLNAQIQSYSDPVSRQALDQRFTAESACFFAAAFHHVLQQALAWPTECPAAQVLRERFPAVKIFDSTQVSLPENLRELFPGCGGGGSPAGVKLLLLYEYIQSQIQPLELLPGKRSDQGLAERALAEVGAGELALLDKGFFKGPALRRLHQGQGFFIIPWPHGVSVWQSQPGDELSPVEVGGQLTDSQQAYVEWPVVSLGQGASALGPVRLIAYRLSQEAANRKRAALREKYRTKGRTPSAQALALAGWLIVVTNVPTEQLAAPLIGRLYRLRWQIELVFKDLKNVLRLDWIPGANPYRLLCEIWARLLCGVLLFVWHRHANAVCWASHQREISFDKLMRIFQQNGQLLAWSLWHDWEKTREILCEIWRKILKCARKETQPSRRTSWENLLLDGLGEMI